jgi:hypothetical protein
LKAVRAMAGAPGRTHTLSLAGSVLRRIAE